MKKITMLLSLAMMGSVAYAAPVVNKAVANKDVKDVEVVSQFASKVDLSKGLKANNVVAKAAPATVEDLCKAYKMSYVWGLNGDDPFGGSLAVMIYKGEKSNEVFLSGIFPSYDIVATVDMTKKTLTVAKQELYYNTNYNEMVYCQPREWVSKTEQKELDSITATIGDDGTITFPETQILSSQISAGWFQMYYKMEIVPLNYFEFDANNYKSAGKATLTEGVFNNILEKYESEGLKKLAPSEVDVMVSNDGKEYVVMNPYKGAWGTYLQSTGFAKGEDGYLVINVENPDCVLLRTLVPSGCYQDERQSETDPESWSEMYFFNMEGYRVYVQGYDTDAVWEEFVGADAPISTYDRETGKIEILNVYFGIPTAPLSPYGFGYYATPGDSSSWVSYEQSFTLQLSTAGVNDIIGDSENVAKRYFNLQGIEVANPAAGELVIVKEGNKTSKTIIR